ncbi:hypothetical protein LTS18_008740 [Coniosporium uncinatum]|uniref:Uncharacterized protein n=1 Tax=Coniosporium uncinatum TaxID=93489 RepID=A0ACC3D1Q1_9PEZI|nr:hypothetical protein LTS18_008740 [Coniosporium uncinatum]
MHINFSSLTWFTTRLSSVRHKLQLLTLEEGTVEPFLYQSSFPVPLISRVEPHTRSGIPLETLSYSPNLNLDPYVEAMPLNSQTPVCDTIVEGAQSMTGGALSNAICRVVPRMPKVSYYEGFTWLWNTLGRRAKSMTLPLYRGGGDLSVPGSKGRCELD